MAIVHWDMMAMAKHAHQQPAVQIYSVLIAVSATKTPNAINIPTALHSVFAEWATLEMVLEKTAALQLLWIHALRSDAETVDFVTEMEQHLIVLAHLVQAHRFATE